MSNVTEFKRRQPPPPPPPTEPRVRPIGVVLEGWIITGHLEELVEHDGDWWQPIEYIAVKARGSNKAAAICAIGPSINEAHLASAANDR